MKLRLLIYKQTCLRLLKQDFELAEGISRDSIARFGSRNAFAEGLDRIASIKEKKNTPPPVTKELIDELYIYEKKSWS